VQAFKWAKRSAQAGYPPAALFLSKLLENGEGTARNPIAALTLVILTTKLSEDEADRSEAELRERELSAALSSSQIRAAGMMAKDAESIASFVASL
jgi:TPR repeat protein